MNEAVLHDLLFLVNILFYFFFFAFVTSLSEEKTLQRVNGYAFALPFGMSVISRLMPTPEQVHAWVDCADLVFIALIILLYAFNWEGLSSSRIRLVSVILTGMVSFLLLAFPESLSLFSSFWFAPGCALLLSLVGTWLTRQEKGIRNILLWFFLMHISVALLQFVSAQPGFFVGMLTIRLASMMLIFLFIHRSMMSSMIERLNRAEKYISSVNKSLEFEVRKRTYEIEESNRRLVMISKTDHFTGALNKNALIESLDELIRNPKTSQVPFSLLMFDIDEFKAINDTYGHITGDKCIKRLSVIARGTLREMDMICRYGGDEFIIVLPGATLVQARQVAERLRSQVIGGTDPKFSVSVGLASYPADGETPKDLIHIADLGLYESKRKGRNAVSYRDVF